MSEKTKKCPKCGEEILASAKVCKHCKSDTRGWFNRHPILSALLIFFLFSFALSSLLNDGAGSSVNSSIATLRVGEDGIVNNNESNAICDGVTVVGVTEEDARTYTESAVANDTEGQAEMLLRGKIFLVNNCTPIRNIATGGSLGSLAKVRFLNNSQDLVSTTGWIPFEFARRK